MGIVRESVLTLVGAAVKINVGPDASALLVLNNSQVIMDGTDVHSNDNDSGLSAVAMLPVNNSLAAAPAPAPGVPADPAADPAAAPAAVPAAVPAAAPVVPLAAAPVVGAAAAPVPPVDPAAVTPPKDAVVDPTPTPPTVAATSVTPPQPNPDAIVGPSSLDVSASTFWNNTWGSVSCGWPGNLEQLRLETSGAGNWTSPGKSVLQSGDLTC